MNAPVLAATHSAERLTHLDDAVAEEVALELGLPAPASISPFAVALTQAIENRTRRKSVSVTFEEEGRESASAPSDTLAGVYTRSQPVEVVPHPFDADGEEEDDADIDELLGDF